MANIKKMEIPGYDSAFDIEALHFNGGSNLDTPAQWKSYIDNAVAVGIQIVVDTQKTGSEEPATAASASTMGKLYFVQITGTTSGTYTEFITLDKGSSANPRYVWEKIGTTSTDLSGYAPIAHTHNITIDISKKLGASASRTTDVAVGANGTASITPYSFTSKKLGVTSITGTNGTETVSKVTAGTAWNALKTASLSDSETTSQGAVSYVKSISGSKPELGGTKTFNTDAIKSVTLSTTTTSTDGPAVLTDVSGTFNTNAISAVSGTKNYGFASSTNGILYNAVVSNDGVLTFSSVNAGTQDAHTGTAASTGSVGKTTKYMKASGTAADTGTVSISGGEYTPTTQYLNVSTTTGSVTPYTVSDKTVAKVASTATTVATGSLVDTGDGASVVATATAGTAVTALTGVKVTTQPAFSVTVTESTTNTGPVNEHITSPTGTANVNS